MTSPARRSVPIRCIAQCSSARLELAVGPAQVGDGVPLGHRCTARTALSRMGGPDRIRRARARHRATGVQLFSLSTDAAADSFVTRELA